MWNNFEKCVGDAIDVGVRLKGAPGEESLVKSDVEKLIKKLTK